MPEIIFQRSDVFDGGKLIFNIQRDSINYPETNFEYQIASGISKRN